MTVNHECTYGTTRLFCTLCNMFGASPMYSSDENMTCSVSCVSMDTGKEYFVLGGLDSECVSTLQK